MKRDRVILLLFFAALLWGCGGSHDARVMAELDRADSLLRTSDTAAHSAALRQMLALDTARALQADEALRARHALLLVQARYKCYVTEPADSVLIDSALSYYADHHGSAADHERYTRALIYSGAVAEELGHPQQAMQHYLEAESTADPNDHFNLGYINLRIAKLYQHQHFVDKYLISKYRQSYKHFNKTPYFHYQIVCMTELGGLYRTIQIDSAFYFANQAHTLAMKQGDSVMISPIKTVLCGLFYAKGMFAECKHTASELIKNNAKAVPENFYYLTMTYAKLGNKDSANIIFNMAPSPEDIPDSVLYHDMVAEIMRLNGKTDDSMSAYKKSVDLAGSTIVASIGPESMVRLISEKTAFLKAEDNHKLQAKSHRYTLLILLLILLMISLTTIYFHHKSKCARRTIHSLQSELEQMDMDENLEEVIGNEVKTIQNLILAYYEKENKDAVKTLRNLKNIAAINNPSSSFWISIERYLNSKHNGIIAQIRKQCPNLEQDDIKILSLYCCGMKPTFIMLAMNYTSLQTVYNKKNVISKRMEPAMSLKEVLDTIKNEEKSVNK